MFVKGLGGFVFKCVSQAVGSQGAESCFGHFIPSHAIPDKIFCPDVGVGGFPT